MTTETIVSVMTNIIDGHSGKRKFFKGSGHKGKSSLDDYQKMLMKCAENGFANETKQKPLTKHQLQKRGYKNPKSLNQLVRWK